MIPGELAVTNARAYYQYTRGRGCNGHPAFPTPSLFRGEPIMQNSGRSCRGNAESYLEIIPTPSSLRTQGPITTDGCCCKGRLATSRNGGITRYGSPRPVRNCALGGDDGNPRCLCEEQFDRRSSTSEDGGDEAIHSFFTRRDGLLRGACHRARIRATRWLAMTASAESAWQMPQIARPSRRDRLQFPANSQLTCGHRIYQHAQKGRRMASLFHFALYHRLARFDD